MNKQLPVLFNRALAIAVEKTRELGVALGPEIMIVRDLRGRIRVVLQGSHSDYAGEMGETLDRLAQQLSESLGPYGFPSNRAVLYTEDLLQGNEILGSHDRRLIATHDGLKIWLLDRQIVGHDWMRAPLERQTTNPRVTFFGIKGGVGRSTALVLWAWRLAVQGKKVLVLDLDVESPGVSSTLLSANFLPDYGVVDWFVEDGVGQASIVEDAMTASSPLARDLPGELRIVPAFGSKTGDYMAKVARCYSEFDGNGLRSWAERLEKMVEKMEDREDPGVVILDSRSGLHDIAAVTVTRMGAYAFLFAVDSEQTWKTYSFLFRHWKKHPKIREFRENLQIVAGMVPETGREDHLKRFTENSWDLFRDNLYDEASAQVTDVFSFDVSSKDAPHYLLPVYWNRALQEFDPLRDGVGVDGQIVEVALGRFMIGAERMVLAGEEEA